ncbi:hypothetical protein SBBP2_2690004 [Burkholderiales bacterium]|nr:hypothetical protein SBBP2_2690004 [Burkholderiales bacterium]
MRMLDCILAQFEDWCVRTQCVRIAIPADAVPWKGPARC